METSSNSDEHIEATYDISKTSEWIKNNKFEKVALQFPDDLLQDSYVVCERLAQLTGKLIYVSVDTTYSNCCVDEISARHVGADAIVHYGHSCLSPCTSTVLFVHPKASLSIDNVMTSILPLTADETKTVVFYHTSYDNIQSNLQEAFRKHPSILIARLRSDLKPSNFSIFGREIVDSNLEIQDVNILDDCQIVYIGEDDQTAFNLAVTSKSKNLHILNTKDYTIKNYSQTVWLKRRRYVIEKCKDAENIGILVCTLSIANFTSIIQRLKDLIKMSGKKSYVLTLGKPNIAKLANVYEIDVFVLIACPENDLYLCRDFLQPIAYPYELELALNISRNQYSGDLVTDFNNLLEGGKNYSEVIGNADCPDVSLITGKARNIASKEELKGLIVNTSEDSSKSLLKREDWAVAEIDIGGALSGRSWRGLEQKLGETPVEKAQMGRSGIASGYQEEPKS